MSPPACVKRGYSPQSPSVPSPGNSSDSAIDSCNGSPPPETAPLQRKRKPVDKESEQYKARRERNNEAVRKSRAKSKLKLRQLQNEKSALELQVEVLQKELLLIRSWVNQPKNEPPEMDGQGVMQNTDYPLLASAGSEEFK